MAKETSKDDKAESSGKTKAQAAGRNTQTASRGFARDHAALYTGIMAALGAVGYVAFFFFPLLALGSAYVIVDEILTTRSYLLIAFAVLLMGLGGFLSYRLFLVRVRPPAGVKIDKENSAKIYALVDKLREDLPGVTIDGIILSDRFEIQIIKTPLWGYPVWSRNTLSIGMPMMLGLTPQHFQIMLQRKLAQFAKKHNLLSNWLYQLRQILEDCQQTLRQSAQRDHQFFALFFQAYLPLFDAFGRYILQLDELNADTALLDLVNDEDVVEALQAEYIVQRFLDNHYWPKIKQMVEQNPKASPVGCARIPPALEASLPKINSKLWLAEAGKLSMLTYDKMPNLRQRLDNLGHDKTRPLTLHKGSAATVLLGDSYYRALKVVDMFWSKNTADIWRREEEIRRKEQAIIHQLQQKSASARLSFKELIQWRNLKQKYSDQPVSLPFYRFILGKLPKTA